MTIQHNPRMPNVFTSFNFTISNIIQQYVLIVNNCKIHILAKNFFLLMVYVPIAEKIREFPKGGGHFGPPLPFCGFLR